MGGSIDWSAMDVVVEMLGVDDVDGWIRALTQIRDFQGTPRDDNKSS